MRRLFPFTPLLMMALPFVARAHEVYVLPRDAVEQAMIMPPLRVFPIIYQHTGQFFFWGFIVAWAVLTVWSISISKPVERMIDPLLKPLKRYAPFVARITLG